MKADKGFLISIQSPSGQNLAKGKTQKQLSGIKDAVFARDKKTCQYCGFSSNKFMRWVAKDGNPHNMQEANMMTVCLLCHDALNCGVRDGKAKGSFIYLPQLTQAELNWIIHTCFIMQSLEGQKNLQHKIMIFFNGLKGNEAVAEKFFGKGSSNPLSLKNVMVMLSKTHYEARNQIFFGLRYLGSIKAYQAEYSTISKLINPDHYDITSLSQVYKQFVK